MRKLALASVLLVGCDVVLGLKEKPRPPLCDAPPVGGPMVDDDGDTIVNADDNCAAASNIEQHDEDLDEIGDACDLCPVGEETRDADCDGIGDACDDNDARADTRQFYGFGSSTGLSVAPLPYAMVVDGVLRGYKEQSFGYANTTGSVAQAGVYETAFTIGTSAGYFDAEIRFGGSTNQPSNDPMDGYRARVIGGTSSRIELGALRSPGEVTLAMTLIPSGIPQGRYTLRVFVDPPAARAEVLGASTQASVEHATQLPVLREQTIFGVRTHEVDIDFEYMSRTGP